MGLSKAVKYCILESCFRGKEILEPLSKTCFLGKIVGFSQHLHSREEKDAIFKLGKNVALRVVLIFFSLYDSLFFN